MALFGWGSKKIVNKPDRQEGYCDTSEYSLWQLISEIRNLASSINMMYAEYDVMEQDVIIGSALNMYADNAIQPDVESGKILQVVSEDKTLAGDLTSVINRLHLEDKLWNVAYNTAKYGNKFWKIILTESGKDIASVMEIDDPSSVMDLWKDGDPKYFAYNEDDETLMKNDEYALYDRNSFVHFMIQSGKINDRIQLRDQEHINEVTGEPELITYKVVRGESMIESCRAIYRVLKMLEDSLLAARIAKSEYTKIFNIETGNANPTDAKKMVDKVKRLFDSKMTMNTTDGQKSAVSYIQPRAFMDPVFNSVNDGKGAISITTTGGEFEVSNIADIDYFNKLKFSALHITPSMLAFEENIPGGLSGSGNTMIQQDLRFALYVKKLVMAVESGIEDLLKIWLKVRGRNSEIGKFSIRVLTPTVTEDLANLQELLQRLQSIDSLSEIIAKNAPGINTAKMTEILLDEYVPNKTLLNRLQPLIDEAVKSSEKELELSNKELESDLEQFNGDQEYFDEDSYQSDAQEVDNGTLEDNNYQSSSDSDFDYSDNDNDSSKVYVSKNNKSNKHVYVSRKSENNNKSNKIHVSQNRRIKRDE